MLSDYATEHSHIVSCYWRAQIMYLGF